MEVIVEIICTVLGFLIGYFLMKQIHRKEMELLAADCSYRIQELSRELVTVCTEPESTSAQEIILRIKLNHVAQEILEKINEKAN